MDPFQGIVVHVISDGQILDLYDDPDAANTNDESTRQHYVEAVSGASFSVRVLLTTDYELYDLKPTDAVQFQMSMDGQHASNVRTVQRQHLKSQLLQEESADTSLSVEQINNLGTIQITVQRVWRETRDVPKPRAMRTRTTTIGEVPEHYLEGSTVSNTISLTNPRPINAREPSYYASHYIPGPVGDVVKYNILYRSRSALQSMGCIPRCPSPAVDVPGHRVASEGVQREVQDLRARLALLERGLNVKPEPTIGVKRERDEVGVDVGSRQRPRRSLKVETVDLTDD